MDISKFIPDSAAIPSNPGQQKVSEIWAKFTESLAKDPAMWVAIMQEGQQRHMEMMASLPTPDKPAEPTKDKRFQASQWQTQPFYNMLMQSYLINADLLRTLAQRVDLAENDKKILLYIIEQYINAMAPSNFPTTNPTVLDEAIKTGGESLVKGMQNLMQDIQDGGTVKNVDTTAFTVGDNVATTPGKVVFANAVMQIIEYQPQTSKVYSKPLLIIPPCINKYYILDLNDKKSLVRHLVEANHRVFLVSWVNAGADVAHLNFDDYLKEGVMAAIDAVQNITQQPTINTLGFCIGGTLLVCALAAMAQDNHHPAHTVTLFTSLLDFSDSGEIGYFIDENAVLEKEAQLQGGGLVDGGELARGFAALRPNDLIWPYIINNYYHGKQPAPFDLLFWNSDSTNLPGPMFCEYMRQTYLENQIANGNATMCGTEIVPSKIKASVYAVACEKDHIVPWQGAYNSTLLVSKQARFVLSHSGHIAGIINPPAQQKGWYKIGSGKTLVARGDEWLNTAQQQDGSWWTDWFKWLKAKSGALKTAPKKFGNTRYSPIEDAPGSFVTAPKPPVATNPNTNNIPTDTTKKE